MGELGNQLRERIDWIRVRPPRHAVLRPVPQCEARRQFQKDVEATLGEWRLSCIPRRMNAVSSVAVGWGEIVGLEVMKACLPFFAGCSQIEHRIRKGMEK